MIVSHTHKFIFIKTRKVGGSSLELAMAKFCGPDDIISPMGPPDEALRRDLGVPGPQNHLMTLTRDSWRYHTPRDMARYLLTRRPIHFYNHMSAPEIRQYIGAERFDSYFKFTVVRNPYDYARSMYYWKNQDPATRPSLSDWVVDHYGDIFPINWHIYTEQDRPAVDYTIRYEALSDGLTEVSNRIGLPENLADIMKTIKAKGNKRPAKAAQRDDRFDDRAIAHIERVSQKEIAEYGYTLDQLG